MSELRELRVYMLSVGIVAAALRIGMIVWVNFQLERSQCVRELLSLCRSYWS